MKYFKVKVDEQGYHQETEQEISLHTFLDLLQEAEINTKIYDTDFSDDVVWFQYLENDTYFGLYISKE